SHAIRKTRREQSTHNGETPLGSALDAHDRGRRPWQIRHDVGAMGMPQHPAAGAEALSRPDLRADLGPAKIPAVEIVVAKRLQPGAESNGRKAGSLLRAPEAQLDDPVGPLERL